MQLEPAADLIELTEELCAFTTGVVAAENERLFKRIQKEVPSLGIFRYPSGMTFNGWVVPQQWTVQRAELRYNGKVVFDGTQHHLGVAMYSKSFAGKITDAELKRHIATYPHLPHGYPFHCMWQYRPWNPDWAFCIPFEVAKSFDPGVYEVDLKTEYQPGEMLVGVAEVPGRSEKTIVLNAHTCHPRMANDGMVGVALCLRLAQWLQRYDHYYTYRLVFGPEHLGTVFYLHNRPRADLERLVSGLFVEMCGVRAPLLIASTFLGAQAIDKAVAQAARTSVSDYRHVPWRQGSGNDETVWEAPGYEVPFVELTRFYVDGKPYATYHSSEDTAASLDRQNTDEIYELLQRVVFILEHNVVIIRKFNGLICLSNPQNNLYIERPDPAVEKRITEESEKWGILQDCLLRYFDGKHSILDIAERHGVHFEDLHRYLKEFERKGWITLEFQPISRNHFAFLDT